MLVNNKDFKKKGNKPVKYGTSQLVGISDHEVNKSLSMAQRKVGSVASDYGQPLSSKPKGNKVKVSG